MSKTNTHENDYLKLILNNVPITLIGDASGILGSSAAGSLYLSGHSADPGEGGDQSTSEIVYTGYARVAVARTTGGFTVSGNQGSLAADTPFPIGTGGAGTPITNIGIGTSATGTGKLLYKGAISPNLPTGAGVTPIVKAGVVITED